MWLLFIFHFLILCRRKLFLPSSESEDELSPVSSRKFFNSNPQLPIFSQISSGYGLSQLIDILMSSDVDQSQVCKVQPLGVNCNCTFIIDLDSVDIEDLKADDNGSWRNNGTRRKYFVLNRVNKPEFLASAPTSQGGYYCIIRRYYVHRTYSKFRRCTVEIRGNCLLSFLKALVY